MSKRNLESIKDTNIHKKINKDVMIKTNSKRNLECIIENSSIDKNKKIKTQNIIVEHSPFKIYVNNNSYNLTKKNQLLNINEVSMIIKEREDKLIEEFNKILLERLDEQHKNFSQYIEDYLFNQYKLNSHKHFDDYIN